MNDSWAAAVGVLIINAWSISLPLFRYRSVFSCTLWLIFPLFSLSSLRFVYRSLYLNTLNQGNNGQKNTTCLFLLLLLFPLLHLLYYHFLSHSTFFCLFTCFFLPLVCQYVINFMCRGREESSRSRELLSHLPFSWVGTRLVAVGSLGSSVLL